MKTKIGQRQRDGKGRNGWWARLRRGWGKRQRRVLRRLDKHVREPGDGLDGDSPVMRGGNVRYEFSQREGGTAYGGVAAMHRLVRELGLPEEIDRRLLLLKIHQPYQESDHVLNFAYNALCGGGCLEDMELRRSDEGYLDSLGAQRTPDPTTAGDFCRRFEPHQVRTLLDILNQTRLKVWQRQSPEFFEEARIDMDGTLVATDAEKKEGIDIAYDGTWGYHPLVVSLANTAEVLSIVNRSGNRPSHEGAAEEADGAIRLCRGAGFRRILLRGDTDFTQTKHLDRWDAEGVTFVFGMDASIPLQIQADDLPGEAWRRLRRPRRYEIKTEPRRKHRHVKRRIVRERAFENIRLESEEVAELDYRPVACKKSYRLVVVRKNLAIERGQERLFDDYRYFFYLTNDRQQAADAIVFVANDRCDQENLHAQLKGGVRSLTTPVDTLVSNWAYMVMTSLAWNLKAWLALWPQPSGSAQERSRAEAEQHAVLRMEFKTFVNGLMRLPAQVIHAGRRLVIRLLSWTPWQLILFRVLKTFRPLRC